MNPKLTESESWKSLYFPTAGNQSIADVQGMKMVMLFHLLESLIRKNCKHVNKIEKLCIILMLNFSQSLDCKLRRVEKSNMKTQCVSSLIHCDQEFG